MLEQSKSDLRLLCEYLRRHYGLDLNVALIHDSAHDQENLRDPRAFCYVDPEYPGEIRCAAALESLRREARIGVLFHEIGHIVLNAFHGDESEVDVDHWCRTFVPESAYTYMDTAYWRDGKGRRPVTAKALEHVSLRFAQAVCNVELF